MNMESKLDDTILNLESAFAACQVENRQLKSKADKLDQLVAFIGDDFPFRIDRLIDDSMTKGHEMASKIASSIASKIANNIPGDTPETEDKEVEALYSKLVDTWAEHLYAWRDEALRLASR